MKISLNSEKLNNFKQEYWVLGLIILLLLTSCALISSRKFFWNDELYSWYLLADSSFFHMLKAFGDKINNTPVLYFVLGWIWAKLFGASELSLRLFSSVGFCLGCVVVWITLRRTYGFWSSTIGILAVFSTSEIVLSQNAEARMYGLFIAVCSFALLMYDTIGRQRQTSNKLLFLNSVVHAAIIHTHLFGLFYSGAVFLSIFIKDIFFDEQKTINERLKVYSSFILAWLSFIFYIPTFLIQSDAGNPHSWIPKPILQDLISLLNLSSASFMRLSVLVLVLLVAGLQFLAFNNPDFPIDRSDQTEQNQKRSLLIIAYTFLAVPIFIWLLSQWGRPIFYDRYLIPSILSWIILITHGTEQLIGIPELGSASLSSKPFSFLTRSARSLLPLTLTIILLLQPIAYTAQSKVEEFPGDKDNLYKYQHLPIVVQFSHVFLQRRFYAVQKDRYFFILDWEVASDQAGGLFDIQEYKHLDAINRNYPNLFNEHILTTEKFLKKYKSFLVLDYANYKKRCSLTDGSTEKAGGWEGFHCPQWVEKRLLADPAYEVTELGTIYDQAILLVRARK